jgi:hypothetical protein
VGRGRNARGGLFENLWLRAQRARLSFMIEHSFRTSGRFCGLEPFGGVDDELKDVLPFVRDR